MNSSDRRRVVLASVFTLVALPALWALNRDTTAASPTVGAAGVDVGDANEGTEPSTTAYQPETPLFVGGDENPTRPAVIDVNVPPPPGANEAIGKASYHRYAGLGVSVCTSLTAPDGAELTITNLDNGQTTTCTNTLGMALPAGSDVVLNTAVYVLIGDLADAPIPVRLSW
ncbi:MAG: hypothetical protein ACOYMR_04310 [Ilumatobacteraceae bacterium]